MKKRTSVYASMNAGDLARITRERGLAKPDVLSISEWADWLEAQDAAKTASTAPTDKVVAQGNDYSEYSNTQLRKLAEERGVSTDGLRSKAELIDALEAADGLTEDEQAAKHAEFNTETPDEAGS